jgi:KEOPS complex subunit Cgi121
MITEKVGSYYLVAQGFRNAKVVDPERVLSDLRRIFRAVEVQLLRADRVAGKEHLLFAAKNAVDSFGGKDRRAKHLSMEFLLFASGEHQIVEAIKLLGVRSSTRELVAIGLSETLPEAHLLITKIAKMVDGEPDDSVIDFRDSSKTTMLKKTYKITEKELNSARVPGETEGMLLKRLVIERSAMLALEN